MVGFKNVKYFIVNKMTSSASAVEGNRHWSSLVLGKIKSLWTMGSSTASTGLNQLATGKLRFILHGFCFKSILYAWCVLMTDAVGVG